jgi:hypothetical protein
VSKNNRPAAAAVFQKYRQPFLDTVAGALTKQLLLRDADVQVLHDFDSTESAHAYLENPLFVSDVVRELAPLLDADPDIRIYQVA